MYFNNVHILYYVVIAIVGLAVGKFIAWCNLRLPEKKKIFSKEFFKQNKEGIKYNYFFMIITAIAYVFLLYKIGLKKEFIKVLELAKFIVLIPILILTFSIDLKNRIIPNRLNLTLFEVGLLFAFLCGITSINMAKEYLFGAALGLLGFGIIFLLGWLIAGKDAIGFGDVKFMGAIGLYFGPNVIIEITLLAFIIAAIASIVVVFVRNLILKRKDEYIAFGPFLSLASLICIFIPSGLVLNNFLAVCQMISNAIF